MPHILGASREIHNHPALGALARRMAGDGPVVAAATVEPHSATVLDDLEAISFGSCSQASPVGMVRQGRLRALDAELWGRTTLGLASDLERLKRRIRPASV
jgi:hypothetical protein